MATKIIKVPDLGGATDVVVIEVLVKVGDSVKVDTPLLTLESDKATMDLPCTDEGVVKEIKVKVNDKISEGTAVLVLETEKAAEKSEPSKKPASETPTQEKKSAPVEKSAPEKPQPKKVEEKEEEEDSVESTDIAIHSGPAVRKLARELGIDLNLISGSGPKSRILREDVTAYAKSRLSGTSTAGLPSAPSVDFAKFGPVETVALSRIKKISGKNLHRNWMLVPHVTQFGEADITTLEEFRQIQKSRLEKQNIKLTPLVFILKAVVAALKKFPEFNASLDASGENLILKNYFHIGVAVDTPDGLVVPVIRDVDKKVMINLAKELGELSEKARKKQLTPQDMQGGCFSISSLGGIGGSAFTPIVNMPEVAILGVSKSSIKPVYENGEFVPRLMLPLSLSYDHRVIDGAQGARFIMCLIEMLSDIRNLLL